MKNSLFCYFPHVRNSADQMKTLKKPLRSVYTILEASDLPVLKIKAASPFQLSPRYVNIRLTEIPLTHPSGSSNFGKVRVYLALVPRAPPNTKLEAKSELDVNRFLFLKIYLSKTSFEGGVLGWMKASHFTLDLKTGEKWVCSFRLLNYNLYTRGV